MNKQINLPHERRGHTGDNLFLPSEIEYLRYQDRFPEISEWCWLRDHDFGCLHDYAKAFYCDHRNVNVAHFQVSTERAVLPLLRIDEDSAVGAHFLRWSPKAEREKELWNAKVLRSVIFSGVPEG